MKQLQYIVKDGTCEECCFNRGDLSDDTCQIIVEHLFGEDVFFENDEDGDICTRKDGGMQVFFEDKMEWVTATDVPVEKGDKVKNISQMIFKVSYVLEGGSFVLESTTGAESYVSPEQRENFTLLKHYKI